MTIELQTTQEVTDLWAAISSGKVNYPLYVDLQAAISRPIGSIAEVDGDAGQHIDPVSAALVPNSGIYRRVAAGWERRSDLATDLFAATEAARDVALSAKDDAEEVLGYLDQFRPYATRVALAAAPKVDGRTAILAETGRWGHFVFTTADISADVAIDPEQGIAIPRSDDLTGLTGGWLRIGAKARLTDWNASWFGVVAGGDMRSKLKNAATLLSLLGGGVLKLPTGVIECVASGADDPSSSLLRGFAFYGLTNVTIAGTGRSTVLKLVDASGLMQVRVLAVLDCTDCTFKDFVVHGNMDDVDFAADSAALTTEQMNGVMSRNNTGVRFQRVFATQTGGDGFNFGGINGEPDSIDRNILLENCGHSYCYRNGITFGGSGWDGITVADHYFGPVDTQQIDCEPTEGGLFRNIVVSNALTVPHGTMNTTATSGVQDRTDEYSIVISGGDGAYLDGFKILGGNLEGSVLIRYAGAVLLDGVSIFSDNTTRDGAIEIDRGSTGIIIQNCPRIEFAGSVGSTFATIFVREVDAAFPANIKIDQNTITGTGQLLYAQDVNQLAITNNLFKAEADYDMLYFHAQSANMVELEISGNIFDATAYTAARKMSNFVVAGAFLFTGARINFNRVLGANVNAFVYGSNGTATQFDLLPFIGNVVPDTCSAFRDVSGQHRHVLLVGGSPRGGAAQYSTYNTPEAALTARVGSTCVVRNGAAGTTFAVKETGTGNTGWVFK